MNNEKIYDLYLSRIHGIGPVRTQFLIDCFGSPRDIFMAEEEEIRKLSETAPDILTVDMAEELIIGRNAAQLEKELKRAEEAGIRIISRGDPEYPSRLKTIYSPPPALYVIGEVPKGDQPSIAIIGSRTCGAYGRDIAYEWGRAFSEAGIDVISGMAAGVDGHAHRGALESAKQRKTGGGKTYAILGCGPDICYPKTNIDIYMELAEHGGIISEFPPGTKPLAERFPQRNRIIAGLSDIVLVVEARIHSGTLITVSHALDQGKDVCCIPGRINDPASAGCNELIKTGARLVTSPQELIEDLLCENKQLSGKRLSTERPSSDQPLKKHIQNDPPGPVIKNGTLMVRQYNKSEKEKKLLEQSLGPAEKIIFASIGAEEKNIEDIIQVSGMSAGKVMEVLVSLEMKGAILSINGVYRQM